MYTSTGTLRYSPKREKSDQHWWLILDCDPALGQYYRHLYHQAHHQCRKLARPFWGPHITIVRNEEPDDAYKHLWDAYAGEELEFQYSGGAGDNYSPERFRSFYWIDVICPRFAEIRKELGLSDISTAWRPGTDFHLTIGSWENPARRDWFFNEYRPR
jgi:hypothetical protein